MNRNKKQRQDASKVFKKKPYAYINSTLQTKAEDRSLNTNSCFGLKTSCKNRGISNKKEKTGNDQQSHSVSHFQYHPAIGNLNNRCFTESYSNKSLNSTEGLCKKKAQRSPFSPQSKTLQKENTNKSHERLPLNASKKRINHSQNKHHE